MTALLITLGQTLALLVWNDCLSPWKPTHTNESTIYHTNMSKIKQNNMTLETNKYFSKHIHNTRGGHTTHTETHTLNSKHKLKRKANLFKLNENFPQI